jgi:hypothetical protein
LQKDPNKSNKIIMQHYCKVETLALVVREIWTGAIMQERFDRL